MRDQDIVSSCLIGVQHIIMKSCIAPLTLHIVLSKEEQRLGSFEHTRNSLSLSLEMTDRGDDVSVIWDILEDI